MSNVQSQQNSQPLTFKGRLFNLKGKQVKSFDLWNLSSKGDEMKLRGNENTDIFVKEFISKENPMGAYDNSIKLSIKNPLFGEQTFIQKLHHETNLPVKGEAKSELQHMDLLTRSNKTDQLEDKALRHSLIDTIKEKSSDLSPIKILNNLLEKSKNHGFSEGRIKDFKFVAKQLNDELISNGVKFIEE